MLSQIQIAFGLNRKPHDHRPQRISRMLDRHWVDNSYDHSALCGRGDEIEGFMMWKINKNNFPMCFIESESGEIIASLPKSSRYSRLIAAAPDLLEAAKRVLPLVQSHYSSDDRGPTDQCTLLEKAIAKAEGKEQS